MKGIIGRAKRDPYWAVQSRFRVIYYIYVCRFVYGKPIQKIRMSNMRGRKYVAQKRACSKSVLGGKQTSDTHIINFYNTLECFSMDKKEAKQKRSLRKLKALEDKG